MRCRRIFGLMFAGAHAFKGCAKRFSAVRILTSINPEDDEIISCTVDVRNTEPNSGRAWHVQPLTYSTGCHLGHCNHFGHALLLRSGRILLC